MQDQLVREPIINSVLLDWSQRYLVLKRHLAVVVDEVLLYLVYAEGTSSGLNALSSLYITFLLSRLPLGSPLALFISRL